MDEELQFEDEIFEEVISEEDDEALDDEVDAPYGDDVDPEDLAFGFSATLPGREIDVDEDTEGDDTVEIEDIEPLTAVEIPGHSSSRHRGDEAELPVDLLLASGQTAAPLRDEE